MLMAVFLSALSACDTNEAPALQPGAFRAQTSGNTRMDLEGQATFSAEQEEAAPMLRLNLRTGSYRPPERPYALPTGIFLRFTWTEQPGTYSVLEPELAIPYSYVELPVQVLGYRLPMRLSVFAGRVTLTQVAEARLEGSFDITARDELGFVEELQVSGSFIADSSSWVPSFEL